MAKNGTYTLSEKAQSIIKTINPHNNWGNYNWIIGSLYAMKEDADPEIVRIVNVDVDRFSAEVSSEDVAVLRNEYAGVIRHCYDKAKNAQLKIYHDERAWEVPSDIVEFCKKAIDPKPEDYTYIPFAGRCEFGLAFDGKCSGYEESLYDWAFDKILIEAFGANVDLTYSESYCIRPDSAEQFDHIVSVPPFLSTATGTPEKFMAEYFRSLLEEHLKEGGNMCLILPLSATYSITWQPFREYLVKNSHSFLTVVISLPAIFSPETSIKCCMFLIEKRENPEGNIIVFEAEGSDFQYAKEPNPLGVSLKIESMLETLSMMDERFVKVAIPGDSNRQYPLLPSRFFIEKELPVLKRGEHFARLRDLVSIVQVDSYKSEELYGRNLTGTETYIRFSSLSDNYMSCNIDISKIPAAPARYITYITEEAGYYASFLNGVIRVGFLPQRIEKLTEDEYWKRALRGDYDAVSYWIGIDGAVFHFRIKVDGEALPDYILRELMSDYVIAQAKRLACLETKTGVALYESDFFNLRIIVPPLEEQERLLKEDQMDAVAKAGNKLDEINEQFRKDIHMMKHSIGQTLANMGNWLAALNDAREEGRGILDDNAVTGGLQTIRVAEVFDRTNTVYKKLRRQIATIDQGYGKVCSTFSLVDFLDQYISDNPVNGVYLVFNSQQYRRRNQNLTAPNAVLDEDEMSSFFSNQSDASLHQEEHLDYPLWFPEEALTIVIDNIISNAISHGHKPSGDPLTILFEIERLGLDTVLFVSNNGLPLSLDMTPDKLFTYGVSTGGGEHAGIGAYQVRNLMEEFDGHAEIISNPDDEFPVKYKLTFTPRNDK